MKGWIAIVVCAACGWFMLASAITPLGNAVGKVSSTLRSVR